jgi:hypothetical protein
MIELDILSKYFFRNPLCNRGMREWIVLPKSFDNYQQATNLPRVEVPPPSRYISILIFLYFKDRETQILYKNG